MFIYVCQCQMLQSSDYSDRIIYELQGSSRTMSYKHEYDKPWQLHEFDAMCNGPIAALLREPEKHAICMKGMMANSEVVHFR